MPTGQPDSESREATFVDRIVSEAMDSGDFDDLPGTGKPIPGAGTVDDDLWWVRSWIQRNRKSDDQDSNSSE